MDQLAKPMEITIYPPEDQGPVRSMGEGLLKPSPSGSRRRTRNSPYGPPVLLGLGHGHGLREDWPPSSSGLRNHELCPQRGNRPLRYHGQSQPGES